MTSRSFFPSNCAYNIKCFQEVIHLDNYVFGAFYQIIQFLQCQIISIFEKTQITITVVGRKVSSRIGSFVVCRERLVIGRNR